MKFRFRLIPFIAALVAAAVGIALGQWQTGRAHDKEAIEASMNARESEPPLRLGEQALPARDIEFRRIVVEGQFVPQWALYLDNRSYRGVAGFFVMMPLKITGSDMHVLVARGWVPRDLADRARLPTIKTPEGMVRIQGVARRSAGHLLQLGSPEPLRPGAIVQNLEVADFARVASFPVQPFIVEQTSDTGDELVRDWPRPSTGIDKHRGYAFQWYALAAMSLIFFVVTGFRRGTD